MTPRHTGINHIINCEEGCEMHAHNNMSVTYTKETIANASPWGKLGRKTGKGSAMTFKVHRLDFFLLRE